MEKLDVLLEPLRASLIQAGAYVPRLAIALLVLVAGWLLAKLARFAVVRALRAVNFSVVTERAGLDACLRQAGVATDMTGIFGALAFWLVILAALVIALNGLGLTYITDLVRQVMLFAPNVVVALLLLVAGAYFARYVGAAVATYCRNAGLRDGELLGRLAQYAVLAFTILIALDQLGVGAIVRASFLILLGGLVLGLALAFGIGGRRRAAALLERWWPSRRTDGARAARTGTDDRREARR